MHKRTVYKVTLEPREESFYASAAEAAWGAAALKMDLGLVTVGKLQWCPQTGEYLVILTEEVVDSE